MATLDCGELDKFANPDCLPAGEYVVSITDSKVGPTKNDPASEMITLTATVLDGPHKNRNTFLRYCTRHKNSQAQNIGRAGFKSLRTAVGRLNPRDTCELHGIPFRVTLKCKEGPKGVENEVSKYAPANKGPAPAAQQVAQQAQAPWARNPAAPAPAAAPSYAPTAAGGDGAALMNGVPYADAAYTQPAIEAVPF